MWAGVKTGDVTEGVPEVMMKEATMALHVTANVNTTAGITVEVTAGTEPPSKGFGMAERAPAGATSTVLAAVITVAFRVRRPRIAWL